MKISCDVIKDLMLLYENGEVSEATKKLVEEHIKSCPSCKALLSTGTGVLEQVQELSDAHHVCDNERDELKEREAKALKKGLGKIKRRWHFSVGAALMLLPLLLAAVLTFDQCTGSGIAFTNMDEIYTAKKFMNLLEKQEFEKAADMLDYTDAYSSIMEVIRGLGLPDLIAAYGENPTMEEYKEKRTEKLLEFLEKMKTAGYSISDIRFNHVYREENYDKGEWTVQMAFTEYGPDSFNQKVIGEFYCKGSKITYQGAMNERQLSAFEYAMGFHGLWNLERIPEYEEYLEMENGRQEKFH
ncbi:MAG: zf-HC2 domain-containing protein [Lachnospiraceae bacterium]|nr:zf-HC2 domain-containing protein [Lachnospiraceae bacterium]